ncbi:hypothetical protein F4779DRAFT_61389 [Xylariaceae sp. FL0662B]|nr:hypothetical protein F4779DRAFT_61389 [Xylariaceae sp. FL0662B]
MGTAFITNLNGRQCTAVPKTDVADGGAAAQTSQTSTSTSTSSSSSSSSSTSTSTSSQSSSTTEAAPTPPIQLNPALSSDPEDTSISSTSTTPEATPSAVPADGAAPVSSTASLSDTSADPLATTEAIPNESASIPAVSSETEALNTDTQTADSFAETPSPTDLSISPISSDSATGDLASLLTSDPDPTGSSLGSESNGAALSCTSQAATGNAISTSTTVAVASGVVGGIVFLALIAFLIWYRRKRSMKQRRNTLLTPLSADPTYRGDEKGPYIINRSSLGPTPFPVKLKAAIGAKYKRLRGHVNDLVVRSTSPSPSVNLDRGNSQFGPPDSPRGRSTSRAREVAGGPQTGKGRFVDWWDRLTEDVDFNWRLRSDARNSRVVGDPFQAAPRETRGGNAPPAMTSQQPDFLTLLSMDDGQLEREAAAARGRGRGSVNEKAPRRRSISLGNEGHFLGGLGLSFDNTDPFSDKNAIDPKSTKPLTVSAPDNPFSDANAVAGPANPAPAAAAAGYRRDARRSRGYSVNSIGRRGSNPVVRLDSIYRDRESGASVESFGTRRHKFRSDPFDLDRPELLQGSNGGGSANNWVGAVARGNSVRSNKGPLNTPQQAHVRSESFTSSKYSSGVSMGDWSDPGPDVGPAAAAGRWAPSPDSRTGSGRRISRESEGSVGKAL